jgi:signal transduction histidine kinase
MGLALVLALLGYLLYNQQKLKNHQLQKESELKQALIKIETQNRLQEQRLRISRDLHDNIGAQLTFIISSLDNLKYGFKDMDGKLSTKLDGISGFTSQTICELRDTIWAMNRNEITFEDLQVRISNFIDSAKIASEKTSFSFKIDSSVNSEHVFSSVHGMNIYRIIQEAVNNALKYSEGNTISVEISEEQKTYKVLIEDDGKGFDLDKFNRGNGLNNMNKRASELGTTLTINSIIGKGTKISFIVS